MVDFTKSTGTSGTLIIRDNGSNNVQLLLSNSQGATFAYGKSWSGRVNGVNVGGSFDIAGVQTVLLGSYTVTSTQDVTVAIGATGTSGLGGPTSFTKRISRALPCCAFWFAGESCFGYAA